MPTPIRQRPPRAIDTDARLQQGGANAPSAPSDPASRDAPVGYVSTRRTAYGQETTSQDTIRVPLFSTPHAHVKVGGSITQNLGDYNSARVEVEVMMPCLPEETEVQRVYNHLSSRVDAMLRRELELATGVNTTGQGQ